MTGAVCGLATVTPASGWVPMYGAFIIGLFASVVCWPFCLLRRRLRWDDGLDVWAVHGIGGALGIILLGCFGSVEFNPNGSDGLFFGGAKFFGKQVAAAALCATWSFLLSFGMLWLEHKLLPGGIKMPEDWEDNVDVLEFGEPGYTEVPSSPAEDNGKGHEMNEVKVDHAKTTKKQPEKQGKREADESDKEKQGKGAPKESDKGQEQGGSSDSESSTGSSDSTSTSSKSEG